MGSLLQSTMNTRALPVGNLRYIRSDYPGNLTETEVQWLLQNDIRTIVDLREEKEYTAKPCSLEHREGFTYFHLPVTGGGDVPASPDAVAGTYLGMLDGQMDRIIGTILNAGSNVLYFCGAGKDRTGVVSAVILKKLGCSDQVILDDYMETKDNLMGFLTRFAAEHPEAEMDTIVPKEENIKKVLEALRTMEERVVNIELKPAGREDAETVWRMQTEAFSELLERYQDYETSPAAENLDKVRARFDQPWTTYYFIMAEGEKVGVIRVVDRKDGSRKRISPIWIMPGHRNKGYGQRAIREAERIYGADHWCLDTILQEKGNLHLYEKLGYHRTGRIEKINERMDIVFYEKDAGEHGNYSVKKVTTDDYDAVYELWSSAEQTRRAMNPVDDSREGIERYLRRNPDTCFAAVRDGRIIGIILSGHDGRRGIIHHLCVHPDCRRMGIAAHLVSLAEEALRREGIQKIFGLVFKDNEAANCFWERQGYSLRTNLNYRNKSLNDGIPAGD